MLEIPRPMLRSVREEAPERFHHRRSDFAPRRLDRPGALGWERFTDGRASSVPVLEGTKTVFFSLDREGTGAFIGVAAPGTDFKNRSAELAILTAETEAGVELDAQEGDCLLKGVAYTAYTVDRGRAVGLVVQPYYIVHAEPRP